MAILELILPPIGAALLAFATVPLVRILALRIGAVDNPDARKVHRHPIPRLGGLAVIVSVAAVLSVMVRGGFLAEDNLIIPLLRGIAFGVLPIIGISVLDDIRSLPPLPKFLVHLCGALIAVVGFGVGLNDSVHLFGREIHLGVFSAIISVVWIVAITNAFNLIDGLDGLSAGLALIASLSLCAVAAIEGFWGVASLALVVAGALIGFLPYNIHPARIFLGDTGSTALGFTMACLAIGGAASRISAGFAVVIPILMLGVPVGETVVSVVRRSIRRMEGDESGIFTADKRHFHHRLLDLGVGHGKAVLILYGAALLTSAAAVASLFLSSRDAALLLLTFLIAGLVGISRLGYDEFAIVRRGILLRYYDTPLLRMSLFIVFVDLAVTVGAIYATIALKFDDWALVQHRDLAMTLLTTMPPLTLVTFTIMRVYWHTWRHATIRDLVRTSTAAVIAAGVGFGLFSVVASDVSLGFFLIYGGVLATGVNLVRASYQLFYGWTRYARGESVGVPVVVYPAGTRGTMALNHLLSKESLELRPIGFLDDDPRKRGKFINGYPVFGGVEELSQLVATSKIAGLILASDKVEPLRLQVARRLCNAAGIPVRNFKLDYRLEDTPTPERVEPESVRPGSAVLTLDRATTLDH